MNLLTSVVLKPTTIFTGHTVLYIVIYMLYWILHHPLSLKFKAINIIKLTLTSAKFNWHDSLWLNGSPFSI